VRPPETVEKTGKLIQREGRYYFRILNSEIIQFDSSRFARRRFAAAAAKHDTYYFRPFSPEVIVTKETQEGCLSFSINKFSELLQRSENLPSLLKRLFRQTVYYDRFAVMMP